MLLFDLLPERGGSVSHTSQLENSNIRIELTFNKPFPMRLRDCCSSNMITVFVKLRASRTKFKSDGHREDTVYAA